MTRLLYILFFVCTGFFALEGGAQITLPSILSDGMILQQKSEVPVWGWAAPGESVSVTGSWDGKGVSAIAGTDGKWMVRLKTPKAGGPFEVRIEGKDLLVLKDVLIGEVWIASGQSNMEMPMRGFPNEPILHAEETMKNAQYPQIRFFTVQKSTAFALQEDARGEWKETTPGNVPNFSAAAYFFALNLYQKLGIPIGIVATNWGGTVAEAWTSEIGLRKLGDFNSQLDKIHYIRDNYEKVRERDEELMKKWDIREQEVWTDLAMPGYDDSDWGRIRVPARWESEGYPELDGIAWYRTTINIPPSWAGKELVLNLGPVNDDDMTWFNGQKIGETEGARENRRYAVPARYVQSGMNTLAIRVVDIGHSGGIYGRDREVKLFPAMHAAGDTLFLAGEWKFKPVADKPVLIKPESANNPSVLYNSMIAPLIPYTIKGAIWYQGESNVGRAKQYNELFPLMIQDWREQWGQGDFPFYFVQIAPFPYGGTGIASAALRDAQRRSLRVKNTGMAVTMDMTDTTTIHPPDKEGVGNRLSALALSRTYKQKGIEDSGPLFRKMKIIKGAAVLSFTGTGKGLVAKDGLLQGFEIAGKDGRFVPAQAEIKGKKVIVRTDPVHPPVVIRYAWRDTSEPSLFNRAGFPASTFITTDAPVN